MVKADSSSRSDVAEWNWMPLTQAIDTQASSLPNISDRNFKKAKPGDDVFHGRVGFALFEATLKGSPKDSASPVLHFDQVDDNATVYLNGTRLLHHEGWDDPFDVPLTGWKQGQENTLDVVVENTAGAGDVGPIRFVKAEKVESPTQATEHFADNSWRTVHLPHDFVIEGAFSPIEDAGHGSLPRNIGWYRKHFSIPEQDRNKDVWIDFDGAFSDAHIWLNGKFVGSHRSGYAGFRFDLKPFLHFGGENILAVRVDSRKAEGWWYEGGGIYRHVWLTEANSVHIAALGGIYVKTAVEGVTTEHPSATLNFAINIVNNSGEPKNRSVESTVYGPNGSEVAKIAVTGTIPAGSSTFHQIIKAGNVRLWSLEHPELYTAKTEIKDGSKVIDADSTHFGIRTIRFDANNGFFLNEKPVKLKGTCNHQDFVGVGIGVPDSIFAWRIRRLKEMGSNAYRCSHNEVASALLDACDKYGMLVMDENREFGDTYTGKANKTTTTNDLSDLRQEVMRDRNHPSVIIWSLGNEEFAVQGGQAGARIARALSRAVKELDDTRYVSAAMNGGHGSEMSGVMDIEGFNYSPQSYAGYHKTHPDKPIYGSETASTVTDRGIYADDKTAGYVKAYDNQGVDWGNGAAAAWEPIAEEPYNAGGFVWTGFDYKGEPTPYGWPCVNSHFGILDICGFPKDNFYYYQAWWGDKPMIHIEPHWNWAGKEGQPIDVWAFTNGDEAELFLNGQSLGRKPSPKYQHVEWSVPYQPGTLVAKSYRNGELIAQDEVSTSGAPAALVVKTDTAKLEGDSEDSSVLEVQIVDSDGRPVPTASDLVTFSAKGPVWIAGVGNGDPSCHEPDRASQRHAFNGKCLGIAQSSGGSGEATITVSAPGLKSAIVRLEVSPSKLH